VVTTETPHALVTGDTVDIAGHADSAPDLNGSHVVTVTADDTFTVDVNVTEAGTGGTVQLATVSLGLVAL
jgi:hypothetical protein